MQLSQPSSATGRVHQYRNTKSATPSKRRAALCSPRPAVWIRISCARRRRSFESWRGRASSAAPTRPGHLHCTWSARKTGHGLMAHIWRLQMPQPGHHPRPLPLPSILHGPVQQAPQMQVRLLHRPGQGVPSGATQHIAKTAIITPFGLFKYLFMPFRLSTQPRPSSAGYSSTCPSCSHHRQPHAGGAPRPTQTVCYHPSGKRPADQPCKVYVCSFS